MSPWPPSTVEDSELWGFVVFELICHRRETHHIWIDTLNRLWRKNLFVTDANGRQVLRQVLPALTPAMLVLRQEPWPLSQLTALLHPNTHRRDQPICDICPILVLEWFGQHFLIDGTTRINRRVRDNAMGPHRVIVIAGSNCGDI